MKLLKDPTNNTFTLMGITEDELSTLRRGLGWAEDQASDEEALEMDKDIERQMEAFK